MTYTRCATVLQLAVLSVYLIGCGGGGGSASSTSPTSTTVVLTIPGDPLPPGVSAFDKISDDVSKLYFASNSVSGESILWEEPNQSGGLLPKTNLRASNYSRSTGWGNSVEIKSALDSSVVMFEKDGLGDIHTGWFTPGDGIYGRSFVNGALQGESKLSATGACLNMEAETSSGGARMVWCEDGSLIGYGVIVGNSWINRGVLTDSLGETLNGSEPSMVTSDNGFIVGWSSKELASDNVSQITALRSAEYDLSGNIVGNDIVATLDPAVTPTNRLFVGKNNERLIAWTDTSANPIRLFASTYTGSWSVPIEVTSSADGYTDIIAHYLDSGDIFLITQRLGREMSIFYGDGTTWTTIDTISDVFSVSSVTKGNELYLVYSTVQEAVGLLMSENMAPKERFRINGNVTDLGLAIISDDTLMGVWKSGTSAFYANIDI